MEALRRCVEELPWDQAMSAATVASAMAAVVALSNAAEVVGGNHDEALGLASSICALCAAASAMEHVPAQCFDAMSTVISTLGRQGASRAMVNQWTVLLMRSEPPVDGLSAEAARAYFEATANAIRVLGTTSPSWTATLGSPAAFVRSWTHEPEVSACVSSLLGWAGQAFDAAAARCAEGAPDGPSLAAAVIAGALSVQDAIPNHFAAMNGLWKRTVVRAAAELLPPGPPANELVGTVLSRALFWADAALQGFVPCVLAGPPREGSGGASGALTPHAWDPAAFVLSPEMLRPAWQMWDGARGQQQGQGQPPAAVVWNPWLSDPLAPKTLPITLLFFLLQVRAPAGGGGGWG